MTVHIFEANDPRMPDALHIRRVVFVDEQRVPIEEDLDGRDVDAVHFLATHAARGGTPIGTARMRLVGDGVAKAERVAVLAAQRGRGVGASLMAALEDEARRRGAVKVKLAAQTDAIPFYERLGYRAHGEVFMDAGIGHRWMDKAL